jgi:hypothetical protein
MRKSRLIPGILVLLTATVVVAAMAQDPPPQQKAGGPPKANPVPPGELDHGESLPWELSPAKVTLGVPGGGERVVRIQRQNPASAAVVRGRYFHRPLLAFAERESPVGGFPKFVWDVDRDSAEDGSVVLFFRMIASTPELRQQCRDAVLREDREYALRNGATPDHVHVLPWPLKEAFVVCQNAATKEVLGTARTGSLTGVENEFKFTMSFGPSELAKFTRFAAADRLEFVFSYSYRGATVWDGAVELKAAKNIGLVAEKKLQSMQVAPDREIFQGEANEVVRYVRITVEKTVRASNKDVIPLLETPALHQLLFVQDPEINLKNLDSLDQKTADHVAAYLKPHLEQIKESYGADGKDIVIRENKSEDIYKTGGNGNVSFKVIGIGFDGGGNRSEEKKREVMDRVERQTGTRWGYDNMKEQYLPHAIHKLKFLGGKEEIPIDQKTTVFLKTGEENRFLLDTEVSSRFTTKTIEVRSVPPDTPYDGIPLGAMIPYFGVKAPRGYVFADGEAHWPNAEWVPEHLRGAKVPDMREHLVGGAKNETDVGGMFTKGKLTVEGYTVNGASFNLPPAKQTRVNGDIKPHKSKFDPDPAGFMILMENYGEVGGFQQTFGKGVHPRFNIAEPGTGWENRIHLTPLVVPTLEGTLNGQQPLPARTVGLTSPEQNPPHLMCRWIIRVE